MRRVSEVELLREPARTLASAPVESAEAVAAEVLLAVARERFDADTCRELERSFWRAIAQRRRSP